MILRVQLEIDDVALDGFRQPLPTYDLLDIDRDALIALVRVPDTDVIDSIAELQAHITADSLPTGELAVDRDAGKSTAEAPIDWESIKTARHNASAHDDWYAHLDRRYQEHAGRFRPKVV